ncbi:MAG: carboxypeptidase regulatory-like domain-containing protein [Nanoarchaeota archaeon]|nr:carboxypeptidase regulatory-like domain-containing protein [Nanoarchaeota archaeon]
MVIKKHTVLILIFVFLIGIGLVKASNHVPISCKVIDNSIETCGGATIFKISEITGGHAEIPSQTNYNNELCCEGSGFSLGNVCGTSESTTLLNLSKVTNAHVQIPSVNTYENGVCLSNPPGMSTSCEYKTDCAADESCIASISADDNAQVADCADPFTNPSSKKICCKCSGTVLGNVRDILDNSGIGGAKIQIVKGATEVSFTFTSFGPTPPLGEYIIEDTACGTYDMIASAGGYVSSVKSNIVLPQQNIVDFILISGTTCEEDCTYASDNTIHKECDTINGCAFFDETAKTVCDLAQPGWIRDYDDLTSCPGGGCLIGGSCVSCSIECAEGSPEGKIETKASVTCELENLIKLTKVLSYKGKLVKLVVVTCG